MTTRLSAWLRSSYDGVVVTVTAASPAEGTRCSKTTDGRRLDNKRAASEYWLDGDAVDRSLVAAVDIVARDCLSVILHVRECVPV